MKLLPIAMIAALAACTQPAAPVANESNASIEMTVPEEPAMPLNDIAVVPSSTTALTAEGWGPLRIGMTRAEVETALGKDGNPGAVGGADPEACDQFHPERAPENMLVMLEKNVLTRISLVRNADIATDRGIKPGDSAAKVRTVYGDAIKGEPHKYLSPKGAYLTTWAKAGGPDTRGIRYEINAEDLVSAIHAGGPAIEYVEGCS